MVLMTRCSNVFSEPTKKKEKRKEKKTEKKHGVAAFTALCTAQSITFIQGTISGRLCHSIVHSFTEHMPSMTVWSVQP